MRAVKVSENIWWVGGIDWNLRDFHGFETPRGTTYNCYLVMGETGIALVDTTKAPFIPEVLARIESVTPLSSITHIVVNHVEPDHNGGLPEAMTAMPQATVVASSVGAKSVAEYHNGLEIGSVKADEVIDLGGRTLTFLPVSMVHWPDSMFTYCPEERVLMPNDAFGQHVASEERFADELGLDEALTQLGIYYANILLPLGTAVGKAIDKVLEKGWALDVVAPSHGVIWRGKDFGAVVERYRRWGSGELRDKAVIVYSTMWGSTATMAAGIAEGISAGGVEVAMHDLAVTPLAHITYDLLEAKALVLGSPTLHHGMLYRVAGYLQYLLGLKPEGRMAGIFGSYGWSKGAEKQMRSRLEEAGFEIIADDFLVKFRPTAEDLEAAEVWGRAFAETVKAR
ncbi:MAG: FprA family A-type flavoprotein [Coriobacteriia bacterium]|jgi:flavorubredoxin